MLLISGTKNSNSLSCMMFAVEFLIGILFDERNLFSRCLGDSVG